MISRMLLAVDDSPASLAAARLATSVAGSLGARLRVVHVVVDHELDRAIQRASVRPAARARASQGRHALLTRVTGMAEAAGAARESALLTGPVGRAVLTDARDWHAELIVIGRSQRSAADPYVGSHARYLLEFAEVPVLVVPPPAC